MSDVVNEARSLKLAFELAADKLDEHFTNVRIARIVGSSVGASCAVVTIGSGIAIPFTLGISLIPFILSIVFGSVGAAGGLTASGASIIGNIIEKKKLAKIKTEWEQFSKVCSDIFGLKSKEEDMNKIARIQEILKDLVGAGTRVGKQVFAMIDAAKTVSQAPAQIAGAGVTNAAKTASVGVTAAVETAATAGVAGASVTSSGATSATTAVAAAASVTKCAATATKTAASTGITSGAAVAAVAKTATTTAKTATTGAATAARFVSAVQAPIVVVNVVLLGLSIHDLVTASIDLHKKNKSKAGDLLRQMAAELDAFFKEDVPTLEQVEECLAFGG